MYSYSWITLVATAITMDIICHTQRSAANHRYKLRHWTPVFHSIYGSQLVRDLLTVCSDYSQCSEQFCKYCHSVHRWLKNNIMLRSDYAWQGVLTNTIIPLQLVLINQTSKDKMLPQWISEFNNSWENFIRWHGRQEIIHFWYTEIKPSLVKIPHPSSLYA